MKRTKTYEKKDFDRARMIAIIFTALYFVLHCISGVMDVMGLPEMIEFLAFFAWIFLPILTFIGWYMCIERYLYLEFQLNENKDSQKNKIYIAISVVIMLLLGIIAFGYAVEVVAFLSRHYSYLNAIADCVAIKWLIALVWIIYWCIGLKTKKILMIQDKGKKIKLIVGCLVFVLLVGVSYYSETYVKEKAEKIRFEKVIEDYDR